MAHKTDVAIIGGGVIGCAVAYYLAKQGARVTVIEQLGDRQRRIVGQSGAIAMATKKPGPALDLAMASQRLYERLSAELGMDLEYAVQGNLIVAESETETIFLEKLARSSARRASSAEIVSARAAGSSNPLLEGSVLAGLYCPTDAQVNPFKVTQAFALAAQNARRARAHRDARGRQSRSTAAVSAASQLRAERWPRTGSSMRRARTPTRSATMVGVEHGVKPRRGQIVVLEATPRMPAVRVAAAESLLAKHGGSSSGSTANVAMSYLARPSERHRAPRQHERIRGIRHAHDARRARRDLPLREAPDAAARGDARGARVGGIAAVLGAGPCSATAAARGLRCCDRPRRRRRRTLADHRRLSSRI